MKAEFSQIQSHLLNNRLLFQEFYNPTRRTNYCLEMPSSLFSYTLKMQLYTGSYSLNVISFVTWPLVTLNTEGGQVINPITSERITQL